jgi:hypothetical protein
MNSHGDSLLEMPERQVSANAVQRRPLAEVLRHSAELFETLLEEYRMELEKVGIELGSDQERRDYRPKIVLFCRQLQLPPEVQASGMFDERLPSWVVADVAAVPIPGKLKTRPALRRDCQFYIRDALGHCIHCGAAGPFNRTVADGFGQAGTEVFRHPRGNSCDRCFDQVSLADALAARTALKTMRARLSAL